MTDGNGMRSMRVLVVLSCVLWRVMQELQLNQEDWHEERARRRAGGDHVALAERRWAGRCKAARLSPRAGSCSSRELCQRCWASLEGLQTAPASRQLGVCMATERPLVAAASPAAATLLDPARHLWQPISCPALCKLSACRGTGHRSLAQPLQPLLACKRRPRVGDAGSSSVRKLRKAGVEQARLSPWQGWMSTPSRATRIRSMSGTWSSGEAARRRQAAWRGHHAPGRL